MYVMCINICIFVTGLLPHKILRADRAVSLIKLLSTGQARRSKDRLEPMRKDNGEDSALPHCEQHPVMSADPGASPLCRHCAPKVQRWEEPGSYFKETYCRSLDFIS